MSEGGFAARSITASAPTTQAPSETPLPKQPSAITRLRTSIDDLSQALKTDSPLVPPFVINLKLALQTATSSRAKANPQDRHTIEELSKEAAILIVRAAAPRILSAEPGKPSLKDFVVDWDEVGRVLDEAYPGAGSLITKGPQLHRDAADVLLRSPAYVPEVFREQAATYLNQWPQFLAITSGLILSQLVVGILVAAPEPIVTKLLAGVIEAAIIAFALHAALTAATGASELAQRWWSMVSNANGDSKMLDAAARTFVELVFAIVSALLAALGGAVAIQHGFAVAARIRDSHGASNQAQLPERTGEPRNKETGSEPTAEGSGKKPSSERQPQGRAIPEYRVERSRVRVRSSRSETLWGIEIEVPLPEGRRTHTLGEGHVGLDEHGAPLGGPSFMINKDALIDGSDVKVQVYEGTKAISATDLVLDEAIAAFKKDFGHAPDSLPGGLAWQNKLNFQRAYATAIDRGMTHDAAGQFAIREISFGRSRMARGYDRFSVDAQNFVEIDLGEPLGVRRVPTTIKINATRSKP